jgi:hypothetical protein
MIIALFWDILQRIVIDTYRRFGKNFLFHLQKSRNPRRNFILPIVCSETSVTNYYYMLHNSQVERRSPLILSFIWNIVEIKWIYYLAFSNITPWNHIGEWIYVKFIEMLTLTLHRASVLFHSPVSLLSMKEPSEITKQGVEIWCGDIS